MSDINEKDDKQAQVVDYKPIVRINRFGGKGHSHTMPASYSKFQMADVNLFENDVFSTSKPSKVEGN